MNDDTISKDPKMQEEARRAAAQVSLPRPPYDPKAISREEFERIMDARYQRDSFEEAWGKLTGFFKERETSECFGTLTEQEYRQVIGGIWHGLNAKNLHAKANEEEDRSSVMSQAVMYATKDRLAINGKGDAYPDLLHGVVSKFGASTRKCALHPNGCPDVGEILGVTAPGGGNILEALRQAIKDRMKK